MAFCRYCSGSSVSAIEGYVLGKTSVTLCSAPANDKKTFKEKNGKMFAVCNQACKSNENLAATNCPYRVPKDMKLFKK